MNLTHHIFERGNAGCFPYDEINFYSIGVVNVDALYRLHLSLQLYQATDMLSKMVFFCWLIYLGLSNHYPGISELAFFYFS